MNAHERVPLAPRTTFAIGGPARFFIECGSEEDVQEALRFASERALPVAVLGGGSNVLAADQGVEGVVLQVAWSQVRVELTDGSVHVHAGAGAEWDAVVKRMTEEGHVGLESMSGVPGTVGGGVVQNIGCYGAQLSDVFVSARVLDRRDPGKGSIIIGKEACRFSYHDSVFGQEPGRYLVLEATFRLMPGGKPRLAYADSRFDMASLAKELGRAPTARDVRELVLKVREEKGTLAHCYRSAGSFFHMPFVSAETFREVERRARALDSEKEMCLRPWAWVQADGSYKLAPGFLLEYTEFKKGYVRGQVGISPKHTLTIINLGNARASEVAALARDMQRAVHALFDVHLEREVEYLGEVEK